MPNNPLLRVFLSSTGRDLSAHRDAVYATLSKIDGIKCVRMEDFGARSQSPQDACVSEVQKSDVLIGIIGHYYGSIVPGRDISFTELEYESAIELDRLMFVASADFPIPAELREPDWKWDCQQRFRERIYDESTIDEFGSPENLASNVAAALANYIHRRPRLRIRVPAGDYVVVVKGPDSAAIQRMSVVSGFDGFIRPVEGQRHVLWATLIPLAKPEPIILDFTDGRLPPEVDFVRQSGAYYRPTKSSDWTFAGIDEPRFEELEEGVQGLLLEPARENHFWSDPEDGPFTLHLKAGVYTAWLEGSGVMRLHLPEKKFVTEQDALTFSLSEDQDVYVAVKGEVRVAQIEEGDYPTSYIECKGTNTVRAADGITFPPPEG